MADIFDRIASEKKTDIFDRIASEAGPAVSDFDPEGTGYDYATAMKYGVTADATDHWPSREPSTGLLLKGRGHETWEKTLAGEAQAGH